MKIREVLNKSDFVQGFIDDFLRPPQAYQLFVLRRDQSNMKVA